jgi:hypothetical protein
VAIDDDAGTSVAETQRVKASLIELAWAKVYTKVIHKDLGAISTAIRKSRPTAAGTEVKKSAEKLRDQLKTANRTVGELSDHVGIRPAPVKK